jgi:hypothetical protein
LGGHGVSPKNSIKGRKKKRLFRRFFTPLLTKNYSFSIKMSIRIKRLSFEMLYCKGKSKNEEYRKYSTPVKCYQKENENEGFFYCK